MELTERSRQSKIEYDKKCPPYAGRIKDEDMAKAIEEYRNNRNLKKQQMFEIMYKLFVEHKLKINYSDPEKE